LAATASNESIARMRTALGGLFQLSKFSDSAQDDVWTPYWSLRKSVDTYSDRADQVNKNRMIAGAGG